MVSVLMIKKVLKNFKLFFHVIKFSVLCFVVFNMTVFAELTLTTSSGSLAIPQGSEVPVLIFTLETTDSSDYLQEVVIENDSNYSFNTFIDGVSLFDSVCIYENSDDDNAFSDDDTKLSCQTTFSSSIGTELEFDVTGTTIASDNLKYFITYEINDDIDMSSDSLDAAHTTNTFFTNVTLSSIDTSENSLEPDVENDEIFITGLDIDFFTDNLQDKLFPSQDLVVLQYFTVTAYGESITNMTLDIFNEDKNFDIDDNDDTEDGIQNVYLYQSNFTDDDLDLYTSFNISTIYSTLVDSLDIDDFTSSSLVSFGDNETIELDELEKAGFWILYDIGDELIVTDNDQTVSFELFNFKGVGELSNYDVSYVTSNVDTTSIPVATVAITDVDSEVDEDESYGSYDDAAILSFYLESYNTNADVTSVTVINTGSVPFAINNTEQDVQTVSIYEDNGDDILFLSTETLIGSLSLGQGNNTYKEAVVPIDLSLSEYDDTEDFPDNNSKKLYVVYSFGTGFDDIDDAGTYTVNASIGDFVVSANYVYFDEVETVTFDGTGSSDSTPVTTENAEITLTETNVSILDIESISPDTAYEGQEKIPMLAIHLEAQTEYSSSYFQLFNENDSYLEDLTSGVKRIWLYLESDESYELEDSSFDEDDDIFLSSSSTWECPTTDDFLTNRNCTSVSNFTIPEDESKMYILYSAGQESQGRTLKLQLYDVDSDILTLTTGGSLPTPQTPAMVTINAKVLNKTDVTISAEQDDVFPIADPSVSFNVTISITNNDSSSTITLFNIEPKVYSTSISGLDISYEFDFDLSDLSDDFEDVELGPGESGEYTFEVNYSTQYTDGTGYLDAYIEYYIDDGTDLIMFERFYDVAWEMAAQNGISGYDVDDFIEIHLEEDTDISSYIPPYIQLPLYIDQDGTREFYNGAAAEEGDKIIVYLNDKESVDVGAFSIVQGTETLSATTSIDCGSTGFYEYSEVEGSITLCVRDESESITIDGTDLYGNTLPTAIISYIVESEIELSSVNFYPNPFVVSSTTLKLGFSITQEATVSVYIYDYVGQLIYEESSYFSTVGFNNFEFSDTASFLKPGIYLARLIAEDDEGITHNSTTRLAVY